jgi:hypothetical protein
MKNLPVGCEPIHKPSEPIESEGHIHQVGQKWEHHQGDNKDQADAWFNRNKIWLGLIKAKHSTVRVNVVCKA